ncbi:hypothetical protein MFUL124B02_43210 [Myxococcus fulvus 124B02]|nr:hypothetical protein MFUL124B02_43210 [Myxococcus fulvus 124B02]
MLTTNVTLAGDVAIHGDVVDAVFATVLMGFPIHPRSWESFR